MNPKLNSLCITFWVCFMLIVAITLTMLSVVMHIVVMLTVVAPFSLLPTVEPRNSNRGGKLNTVDLLIKVVRFKKVLKILYLKRS